MLLRCLIILAYELLFLLWVSKHCPRLVKSHSKDVGTSSLKSSCQYPWWPVRYWVSQDKGIGESRVDFKLLSFANLISHSFTVQSPASAPESSLPTIIRTTTCLPHRFHRTLHYLMGFHPQLTLSEEDRSLHYFFILPGTGFRTAIVYLLAYVFYYD